MPGRGHAISAFLIDNLKSGLKVNRRCDGVCPPFVGVGGAAVLMNAWSGLVVLIAE